MERGIAAQSSKDITSFKSVVPGRDRGTADIMRDPALRRYTQITSIDWPGATVPERLMMLFREAKKSDSRRPIVISSIVVAAISIALIAATLINGALNPGDGQNPLGKGDLYVPVLVADADDLGVLEMTIEYDDAVLSGISATSGPIAETAAVDCSVETPGIMKVRMVAANGVSGSGAIVLLRFRVDEIVLKPAALDVTAVTASGSLSMTTVPVEFEDGSVNTATLESVAPVVRF